MPGSVDNSWSFAPVVTNLLQQLSFTSGLRHLSSVVLQEASVSVRFLVKPYQSYKSA